MTDYHKNQLELDRRLCGVGGKTLDCLRQLLSKLNSFKVTQMMYDDVVSLRFIQTHSGSCKSPHSNSVATRIMQSRSDSHSLAQIHSASLRLAQLQCQQLSHSDPLCHTQWDSLSSAEIHSVPLKSAEYYSDAFSPIWIHSAGLRLLQIHSDSSRLLILAPLNEICKISCR